MNKYRDFSLPVLHDIALTLVNRHAPHDLNYAERAAWLSGFDKDLSQAIVERETFFPQVRQNRQPIAHGVDPRKAGGR